MKEKFSAEYHEISKWHWWYKGRRAIIFSIIEKYFNPKIHNNLLDVGCGSGEMLNDLSKFGKIFSVEYDLKSIKLCTQNGYHNTCLSEAENLPFRDSFFSIVLMLDVLEHLDSDEVGVKEAVRVCKPGGIIVLTVPAFQFLWGNQDIVSNHKRRYCIRDIKALVDPNELSVVKASYFSFFLFPIIAVLRVSRNLLFNDYKKVETTVKSDFSFNKPGLFNNILTAIFYLEYKLIGSLDFAVGSSIICILEKR